MKVLEILCRAVLSKLCAAAHWCAVEYAQVCRENILKIQKIGGF